MHGFWLPHIRESMTIRLSPDVSPQLQGSADRRQIWTRGFKDSHSIWSMQAVVETQCKLC
jgi:hypothetical protein